jgi:transcriptional regulator with XRE-family HTH domain
LELGRNLAPGLVIRLLRPYARKVFRERLNFEFGKRKQDCPNYSLRAFANLLGMDHSTLSQILRGYRRATVSQIRAAGKILGLSPEEITVYLAAEHVPDAGTAARQDQLRQWTVHWEILRLCREPGFRADCRWIAGKAEVTVDAVNIALTRLLRLRLIDGSWKDLTGAKARTASAFRKLALSRVQEKAAEDSIRFRNANR